MYKPSKSCTEETIIFNDCVWYSDLISFVVVIKDDDKFTVLFFFIFVLHLVFKLSHDCINCFMFVFANIRICRYTILVCVFKGLYRKVDKYHSTRCYDSFSYNSKSVLSWILTYMNLRISMYADICIYTQASQMFMIIFGETNGESIHDLFSLIVWTWIVWHTDTGNKNNVSF